MEEEKRKRPPGNAVQRLLRIPLVRILGLAVLVVLLIVAAAAVLGGISKKSAEGDPEDYLYPVSAEGIVDLQGYDDGLAVLQTNSLCYIDDAGVEIDLHEHTYANPVLRTAGKYALLFDRGGTQFRLEKNAAILNECPTDAAITTADVSKNGTYAYILNAHEGYQSHLYVYNEKGEKQFEWGSAADYATLFQLAENGKKAVLVSFVTENAEYASKIISFDFGETEPLFSVQLDKTAVFAVKFLPGGAFAVFADNGVYQLDKNGEVEKLREYSSSEINCAAVTDSDISALSLHLYGNEHNGEITLYDKKMRVLDTYTGSSTVTALAAAHNYVAVAAGNRLQILSKNKTVRSVLMDESCLKCVVKKNAVFVLTPGGVRAYDVAGADTAEAFVQRAEQQAETQKETPSA